jgi:threonine synthase
MTSFELECGKCGERRAAVPLATLCETCGKPLLVRYELDALDGSMLKDAWGRRHCDQGMWRFRELMPIGPDEDPVTLGEGATPLLPLSESVGGLDGIKAYVKDEGRNPTGSFKDRGLSAAVTRASHEGATAFVIPSAGNAGVSLAAYASRAGLPARVYLPADTPAAVARRTEAAGGDLRYDEGLITDCGRRARE